MLRQPGQGPGQQIHTGAPRNIVDDHRHRGGVGHRGKMPEQAVLGGLVVIRRHHQHGVGPGRAGVAGIGQDMLGVVGAGTGDDGDPARHLFHGIADDPGLVLRLDGGVLAGGTHDHQSVDAAFHLEFDEPSQGFIVDAVGGHGGDNGGSHAGKDGVLHFFLSLWFGGCRTPVRGPSECASAAPGRSDPGSGFRL